MPNTVSFNKLAAEYDAWFEHHRDLYQAELEAVRSLIPARVSGWSRFYRDATFYSVSDLERLLTRSGFAGFAYRQARFPEEAFIGLTAPFPRRYRAALVRCHSNGASSRSVGEMVQEAL